MCSGGLSGEWYALVSLLSSIYQLMYTTSHMKWVDMSLIAEELLLVDILLYHNVTSLSPRWKQQNMSVEK